ncbi:hypothetical protein [Nocardiopsis halotolerans]|uniref:hypothetical protein n=1 Tax=Nocardiopsis halotolerans TaxID=124252 RepID=UPI000346D0A5|nr:hypothetical protein [Nocardiopsis halotolerans]
MPGYALYPSRKVQRLRTDFPDHLICEFHDEAGRPVFVATLARRCCPCPADLVTATSVADLRRALTPERRTAR